MNATKGGICAGALPVPLVVKESCQFDYFSFESLQHYSERMEFSRA